MTKNNFIFMAIYRINFSRFAHMSVRGLRLLWLCSSLALMCELVQAEENHLSDTSPFMVEDIRIQGLQRVDDALAFNNLSLQVGDEIDQRAIAAATRQLFKSGYFDDIVINRVGNELLITVKERPAIADLNISGNKFIATEQLVQALEQASLSTGSILKRSSLANIEKQLEQEYKAQARYSVLVDAQIIPLEKNRVKINIIIDEGHNAVITYINIIGNKDYSDDQLLSLMQLKTDSFWSLFTSSSQYSREKLSADLETIRSFYLDRGYVLFNFESTQVSVSPDRQQIFITITVNEGAKFTINKVSIAGNVPVEQKAVLDLTKTLEDAVFSRQRLINTGQDIEQLLGDSGYVTARIEPVPLINQNDNTVDIQFAIKPGKRTYVRRINFIGNTRTEDEVLRREMRLVEGGLVSFAAIRDSRLRLQRLGFFNDVKVNTDLVAGTDDLMDITFEVVEGLTANWAVRVGYTDGEGVFWGGSITQRNFFGTGNEVEAGFTSSASTDEFNFKYVNPYFTPSGVSSGVNVFYAKRDYAKVDISSYATDRVGAQIEFGYPVSPTSTVDFSLGYEDIDLEVGAGTSFLNDFVAAEGTHYKQHQISLGWNNNTLNDFWYPTDGSSHSINMQLELPSSDLNYHRTLYKYRTFFELDQKADYVASFGAQLGYASTYNKTQYTPPFANYFAGGVGSVRGFNNNSLGPKASDGSSLGGEILTTFTGEFIFPMFTDNPAVRTMLFVDIGNVFDADQYEVSDLRVSTGLSLAWLTPVGPLTFVVATPIQSQSGDSINRTHLSLGRSY